MREPGRAPAERSRLGEDELRNGAQARRAAGRRGAELEDDGSLGKAAGVRQREAWNTREQAGKARSEASGRRPMQAV